MSQPGRPTTDVVMAMVEALSRSGDLEARRAMRPFVGTRNADLALPHVRRQCKRILMDRDLMVSRQLRDKIKEFGAMYGLQIRGNAPMTERLNLRFTSEQKAEFERAMRVLQSADLAEFIRNAAVNEARRINGTTEAVQSG